MTDAADGSTDFDYLFGRWRVRHRKLLKWLVGSEEWLAFDGTCVAQPVMGGMGNIDDNVLNDPRRAYRAATVRQYDRAAGNWSIWWLDERYPGLGTPVVGKFENGVGTFLEETTHDDKPVIVRYLWSEITPSSARWQQALSPDGGKTWETNWDMQFEREA